jgi:hypothetical protein
LHNCILGGEALSNFNKKFPWTDFHGFNLDWVIKTVDYCLKTTESIVAQVNNIVKDYLKTTDYEKDILKRKLSKTGNFTGTIQGIPSMTIVTKTDSNNKTLQYLTSQFADGQTGLVIDGGFFEDEGIDKNYDGGNF